MNVCTAEKVAAAKIHLEQHYGDLLLDSPAPREIRRRILEKTIAGAAHDERVRARQRWIRTESEHLRQTRVLKATAIARHCLKGITVAGFDGIRVLGKGSFGVVKLVTERSSNADNVFAMKVIRKSDMLRACQEGHLRAERDFLVAAEGSRWVVPLIASFQDNTNLYLVMEYMIGGDFLGLLLREDVLEEEVARWYVAEMILCVEEVHKMGWIHRDIKPDNFLISTSGHLKIADFGLAFDGHWAHSQAYYANHRYGLLERFGIRITGDEEDVVEASRATDDADKCTLSRPTPNHDERLLDWRNRTERRKLARSVVGTSQYMAPEVIMGEPYDGRCDWWSVGIIGYESFYGRTPFYCENRLKTKESIVQHRSTLEFPDHERWSRPTSETRRLLPPPTETAINFLQALLTEKDLRLGGRDVKSHPWLKSIPWSQMHLMPPPFVPKIKDGQLISKYFEDEEHIAADYSSIEAGKETEKSKKEVKRPRDKLLRDPVVGRKVMEIRKKDAFFGYTYRRPKMLV